MQARRNHWVTAIAISLPQIYRNTLSLFMLDSCRYVPTCSVYAEQALHKHGFMRGVWLTARRLLRCHPFAGFGMDPVP